MARRKKNFASAGSAPPTASTANVDKSYSDSSDADENVDKSDDGNRKKRKKVRTNTDNISSDSSIVHELRVKIESQRNMIIALTSRLNFVLSMFGIDELSTCDQQESSYSQRVQQTVSQSGGMAGGSLSLIHI